MKTFNKDRLERIVSTLVQIIIGLAGGQGVGELLNASPDTEKLLVVVLGTLAAIVKVWLAKYIGNKNDASWINTPPQLPEDK